MGVSGSRLSDGHLHDLLSKLAGQESLAHNDPFWETLLTYSLKPTVDVEDDKRICEGVKANCATFALNNLKTGNLGTLIRVYMEKCSLILVSPHTENDKVVFQIFNALYITRCFLQYLVQKCTESEVIRHIEAQQIDKGAGELNKDLESVLVQLVDSLVDVIIHVPLKNSTYMLHCEAINVLLVLLSIQLFTTQRTQELEIYKVVSECKQPEALCRTLLTRYVEQHKLPTDSGGSIILGLAAEIFNLFISQTESQSPLGRKSALLCVVLVNHNVDTTNPFKECLSNISDGLSELYDTLCSTLDKEETTLLLYHLMHKNSHFKAYVLSRSDLDCLVVPMMKTIYLASDISCHHVYMSLIILLILTEDVIFNKVVHTVVVKNIPWYAERQLPDLTLGCLIILVTTRTVQHNLLKMRDEYLHSNCFAALANMSSQFVNLHPYVCQRLVGLFEILAKTYNRAKQELVAIEIALRIILEVINSCLSNQLVHNSNLIYTLLYNRNIFEPFKNHPALQEIISNIDQVLEYFYNKIDLCDSCIDVNSVLKIVQTSAPQWPSHCLQKFPDLKFKYVEEERPEIFFIPYVWSLVAKYSGLHWQQSLFKQC